MFKFKKAQGAKLQKNIPILPESFLTFASKSSIGPSCAAHGTYTLCADFSGTERDREKEQVQTIRRTLTLDLGM